MTNRAETTEPAPETTDRDGQADSGEDGDPSSRPTINAALARGEADDDRPEAETTEPSEDPDGPADRSDQDDRAGSPEPDTLDGGQAEARPEKETVLEMRQVAGLTAGSVMGLHVGSFQFRESDREVGFSLQVASEDEVLVMPGAASAMVDEVTVTENTELDDAVLNVGSACFTVRPPRAPLTTEQLVDALEGARRAPSPITVPDFGEAEETTERASRRTRRSKSADAGNGRSEGERFLDTIRRTRSAVAERHRRLHPDPEELRSRLELLSPGLWDRSVEHPLFARFAVAYATIPWEPRFDDPDKIPLELHQPIQQMSCLPWVPITANLLYGPLGIVGSRSAVLACARHAILSVAALNAPADIEFSIVTAQGLVEDWAWTSSLPNSLFPIGRGGYCIAVADGMTHFDGAGFDHETVKNHEMGLIVLAESADELPDYCATTLELLDGGRCQVTNHLGEQIIGTPIGVTTNFAADSASLIKDAVGDGPGGDDEDDLLELLDAADDQPEDTSEEE